VADSAEPTTLRPMTAAEWPAWAAQIDRGYVEQMVEMGGMTEEAAEAKAASDWPVLLPDGPLTAGHSYFVAEAGGRRVATLWLGERHDDLLQGVQVSGARGDLGHDAIEVTLVEGESLRLRGRPQRARAT
jgi:hypothetical protein